MGNINVDINLFNRDDTSTEALVDPYVVQEQLLADLSLLAHRQTNIAQRQKIEQTRNMLRNDNRVVAHIDQLWDIHDAVQDVV